MQKLPTEYIANAARIMYVQHVREHREHPDLENATHELGQWEDGRYYLRVNFPDGHWWELAFGPEADAIIEAAKATRH